MGGPADQQAEHDELPGSGFKTVSLAKEKHSATEKRRRDRIAEGYSLMTSHSLGLSVRVTAKSINASGNQEPQCLHAP